MLEMVRDTAAAHPAAYPAANNQSDSDKIDDLIELGSDPASIRRIQAMAAKTIAQLRVPGLVYPTKSCAAVLSHFLREAGIDVQITTGAQRLADRLRVGRGWKKIKVGDQKPGDVGVCFSQSHDVPGADHIYLVVECKDKDLMVIADNQAQGRTHNRYASGRGKTGTEYFLRPAAARSSMAAGAAAAINENEELPDDNTWELPEPYMDNGAPRMMNGDGSPLIVE